MQCYSELVKLKTFRERFEYLSLNGAVGVETFGFERYLNQMFYRSREWKLVRSGVQPRPISIFRIPLYRHGQVSFGFLSCHSLAFIIRSSP